MKMPCSNQLKVNCYLIWLLRKIHFCGSNQTWLNMKWSHEHALLKSIESKLLAYLTAEKNAFLSKVFLSSCYCNQVVPEHHFQRDRFKIRTGEENLPKRRYEATSLVKIKRPKSIIKNNRPFHLTQIDWEAR